MPAPIRRYASFFAKSALRAGVGAGMNTLNRLRNSRQGHVGKMNEQYAKSLRERAARMEMEEYQGHDLEAKRVSQRDQRELRQQQLQQPLILRETQNSIYQALMLKFRGQRVDVKRLTVIAMNLSRNIDGQMLLGLSPNQRVSLLLDVLNRSSSINRVIQNYNERDLETVSEEIQGHLERALRQ
ncbi:MAG: hypothetical protein NTY48_07120 [Candidatus Diapherotrites archaeon]|nr:hypothetical protein [Candidatus Diapherotrites archaeon]